MDWDPAVREKWCGPCGQMRPPDGCAHRRAAAATRRGHAGIGSGDQDRSRGEWLGDLVEMLFDGTLGTVGRVIAAAFRAMVD